MSISTLTNGFALAIGVLGLSSIATAANAAAINFSTWSAYGDVLTSGNTASLSTNALQNDDLHDDSNLNFSGNGAVDFFTFDLESNLGLATGSLSPDFDNFIEAIEGSGFNQELTFETRTKLEFDFSFLTNDETFVDFEGFRFADNGLFFFDDTVISLASTDSALTASTTTNYAQEITGTYSRTFAAGTYSVGFAVVDVGDAVDSSGLIISGLQTESVPEATSTIALFALAGLGLFQARRSRVNS